MPDNIHPLLKNMIPLAEAIAKTFGKNCEVSVHDISTPHNSIIAIFNGHVTGRKVGGPMLDTTIRALKDGLRGQDKINISSKSNEGKLLKSSSIFIRDEKGKIIGCLNINYDLSEFIMFDNLIKDFCQTESSSSSEILVESENSNVNDVLTNMVDITLKNYGKPVNFMTKEEKVNVVKLLDTKGVFLIKGAIDYVAKVLCVSRYTIYNYLDEIRVGEDIF